MVFLQFKSNLNTCPNSIKYITLFPQQFIYELFIRHVSCIWIIWDTYFYVCYESCYLKQQTKKVFVVSINIYHRWFWRSEKITSSLASWDSLIFYKIVYMLFSQLLLHFKIKFKTIHKLIFILTGFAITFYSSILSSYNKASTKFCTKWLRKLLQYSLPSKFSYWYLQHIHHQILHHQQHFFCKAVRLQGSLSCKTEIIQYESKEQSLPFKSSNILPLVLGGRKIGGGGKKLKPTIERWCLIFSQVGKRWL